MASTEAAKSKKTAEANGQKGAVSASKAKATNAATRGVGIVKSVPSGTTVVISGVATQGKLIPPEKFIILSGISAPRLQRSKGKDPDEPYAFHAREFLRKRLIGKEVSFTIKTSVDGREYGDLQLNGESICDSLVAAGYATVKGATNKDGKMHGDREALYGLQTQAESAGRGIHNKSVKAETMVRKIDYEPDGFAFFTENKDKPVPVIVDYVHNGSTVSVEVVSEDLKNKVFNVTLCGIVCPRTAPTRKGGKGKGGKDQKVNPVAAYAQYYVSKRLLHRDMELIVKGVDKYGNLFGRLVFSAFPDRDITKMLLKHGLGKYLDWTASMLEPNLRAQYRALEAQAREAKVGRWHTAKDALVSGEKKTIPMKVVMVLSGDSFTVVDGNGKEKRLSLASIRTPRLGRRDQKESEACGFEAKEWLRKKLVGKKVNVTFEYKRGTGTSTTDSVSIGTGRSNINLQLCQMGYASVIPHRLEEARAHNYVQLVEAEKKAEKEKKGIHAKNAPVHKYIDLTERSRGKKGDAKTGEDGKKEKTENDKARAEALLPQLAGHQLRGHVEYVYSGRQFKVYLPSKKLMCNISLAGLSVPRSAGKNEAGDKFGTEAHNFVKRMVLQQNVIVELPEGDKTVDRRGAFAGYIWTESPKQSVSCALLEQGYAKIFMHGVDPAYLAEFRAAENSAKKKLLRIWENYEEEEKKRKAARDEMMKSQQKAKYQKIKVTEIIDGVSFYATTAEDASLKKVEDELKKIEGDQPEDFEAEFGMIAACKYDGVWYRVQVTDTDDSEGWADVMFIDYGNKSRVQISELMPISDDISKIPPLAKKYKLAGVNNPPEGSGWDGPAFERLGELIYDKEWNAEVLNVDKEGMHVSLKSENEEDKPVQAELLKEGLIRLVKRADYTNRNVVKSLREYQREGIEARAGIWEYGEISDEEEEETGKRRRR